MRLKVISRRIADGRYDVKVVDAATGEALERVTHASFECSPGGPPILRIGLLDFDCDVEAEAMIHRDFLHK